MFKFINIRLEIFLELKFEWESLFSKDFSLKKLFFCFQQLTTPEGGIFHVKNDF